MAKLAPSAPYAPIDNVLTFVRRHRERGLPGPVGAHILEQIGIPAGNTSRTLAALKFLGLVDPDGRQTEQLAGLRCDSTEYPLRLAEIVRRAYALVLSVVDPAQDDLDAVRHAFAQFEPAAQRERMATLFLGLCREARIIPDGVRRRRTARPALQRRMLPARQRGTWAGDAPAALALVPPPNLDADYRLPFILVQQLPQNRKWTRAQRERWMQALRSVVDLLVEVTDDTYDNVGQSPIGKVA